MHSKKSQRKKVEKTEVEKLSLTRKSLDEMKKDIRRKNLYPELPMNFEESGIPENNAIYEQYQMRCDQNFQNEFADKSPDACLLQNQFVHQLPTRTDDRNDSQFMTNGNEKPLPQQVSGSDSMEEESPKKKAKKQQNSKKKARQDELVKQIFQTVQNAHKESAKPRSHKKISQETSKPLSSEVIRNWQFIHKIQKNFSIKYLWLIIVPFIFFLLSTFYVSAFPTNQEKNLFNASDVIYNLKTEFGEQLHMSYRIIYSALKKVSDGKSVAPAIIVLLAANGSETVCNNFAHKLSNLLPCPDNSVQLSGEDYISSNINKAKKEIDDSLKTLKVDQLSSVLVEDLNKIPGKVALIFHTYWDHENAPYKKAVFVMTVAHGKTIDKNAAPKVWDKALQDHLYTAWSDTGVDQISALLSRLTVSVAAIVG